MNEWISVKDRLPDDDNEVLVFDKYCFIGFKNKKQWFNEDGLPEKKITHWMPLPEPPKEAA